MFRTLIRYSQRFAWLILLAATAVGVASSQTQDKKAEQANQPADWLHVPGCCRGLKEKPAERVVETKKGGAIQTTGQKTNHIKILKPTGDQKAKAKETGAKQGNDQTPSLNRSRIRSGIF